MTKLEINVQGSGSAIRRAERALLVLEATSGQRNTQEEASRLVTLTANKIRDTITPHCPQDEETGQTKENSPIAHFSMTSLETSSYRERINTNDKDAKEATYHTTYTGRASFTIKFADFSVLDELATLFSAMDNVRIERIKWALTDATTNSIKGGARKQAAEDAIQRARDYAEVFAGVDAGTAAKKVKAVKINEGHHYSQSTRPKLHYGKAQRMYGHVVEKSDLLRFEPEDVSLEVSIDGKFEIEI